MIDTVYFRQVELLLRVLPLVDREAVFALKGGTAINFFVRDLPPPSPRRGDGSENDPRYERGYFWHFLRRPALSDA